MKIRKICVADFGVLCQLATNLLEPIYGDQRKALREWFSGEGFKHAFVIVEKDVVKGFLSLKANPLKPYLKISTLIVLEGHKGKGLGKRLLVKAKEVARALEYRKVKVTVASSKAESLTFFLRNGFIEIDKKPGKYRAGETEHIFEMEVR